MKKLYAPWRQDYTFKTAHKKDDGKNTESCVFCTNFSENNDEKYFIIKRYKHNTVVLNIYPYNAGHLLVIPLEHVADLDAMSKDARAELMELLTIGTKAVTKTLDAHGVNVGLNLGKVSGASIPSHLHFHIVPRYYGDTNFLPVIGETKQVSTDLTHVYKAIQDYLNQDDLKE